MQNRELPAFFAEEARLRQEREIAGQLGSDRGEIGNFFRDIGPWFVGLFSFLVSYGLLLTFGLLALAALLMGFATFSDITPSGTVDTPATLADVARTARTAIRWIAFGAAFLALWPGWFGASVARRHFEATR